MRKKDNIGRKVKREVTRAMFERTQSMDLKKSMAMFGATEPVVYEDVEENLNVAYVNRDEVALAMDIFKPIKEKKSELPVIIAIHGGGLFMGDRSLERPYCRLLAHKGYLVFSLEYRLAPKANICEQLDDVCAGLDRVGRMLVDYDVDFSRIFLVADSAGAYLGAYVSAMHGSEKLQTAIGHKPSRMVYAAVGFICGMFYTSRML
jgi:acetyl esterase/lipase